MLHFLYTTTLSLQPPKYFIHPRYLVESTSRCQS